MMIMLRILHTLIGQEVGHLLLGHTGEYTGILAVQRVDLQDLLPITVMEDLLDSLLEAITGLITENFQGDGMVIARPPG